LKNFKAPFHKKIFGKFLKFLKFPKIKFYENFWLYGTLFMAKMTAGTSMPNAFLLKNYKK